MSPSVLHAGKPIPRLFHLRSATTIFGHRVQMLLGPFATLANILDPRFRGLNLSMDNRGAAFRKLGDIVGNLTWAVSDMKAFT